MLSLWDFDVNWMLFIELENNDVSKNALKHVLKSVPHILRETEMSLQ